MHILQAISSVENSNLYTSDGLQRTGWRRGRQHQRRGAGRLAARSPTTPSRRGSPRTTLGTGLLLLPANMYTSLEILLWLQVTS